MFVRLTRLAVRPLKVGLADTTLVGKTVVCKRVVFGCLVSICENVLPANLVVFSMNGYNVILGMDWLAKHYTSINFTQKQVMLKPWSEAEVTSMGSRVKPLQSAVSAV